MAARLSLFQTAQALADYNRAKHDAEQARPRRRGRRPRQRGAARAHRSAAAADKSVYRSSGSVHTTISSCCRRGRTRACSRRVLATGARPSKPPRRPTLTAELPAALATLEAPSLESAASSEAAAPIRSLGYASGHELVVEYRDDDDDDYDDGEREPPVDVFASPFPSSARQLDMLGHHATPTRGATTRTFPGRSGSIDALLDAHPRVESLRWDISGTHRVSRPLRAFTAHTDADVAEITLDARSCLEELRATSRQPSRCRARRSRGYLGAAADRAHRHGVRGALVRAARPRAGPRVRAARHEPARHELLRRRPADAPRDGRVAGASRAHAGRGQLRRRPRFRAHVQRAGRRDHVRARDVRVDRGLPARACSSVALAAPAPAPRRRRACPRRRAALRAAHARASRQPVGVGGVSSLPACTFPRSSSSSRAPLCVDRCSTPRRRRASHGCLRRAPRARFLLHVSEPALEGAWTRRCARSRARPGGLAQLAEPLRPRGFLILLPDWRVSWTRRRTSRAASDGRSWLNGGNGVVDQDTLGSPPPSGTFRGTVTGGSRVAWPPPGREAGGRASQPTVRPAWRGRGARTKTRASHTLSGAYLRSRDATARAPTNPAR